MTWIEEIRSEHLPCRDTGIGHAWKPITVHREGRAYVETLVCGQCGSEKIRTLTARGEPKKAKTHYADGYLREGGGRMSRKDNAAVRLAGIKRRYTDSETETEKGPES